ncbi:hypothetical protein GY45DRAFT_1327489 [Cubamyces sp. BRFM 1775]|nr:hypothetical protein GY45DRAFT_1327489 [Cubamyces sp. BRFM 1775]
MESAGRVRVTLSEKPRPIKEPPMVGILSGYARPRGYDPERRGDDLSATQRVRCWVLIRRDIQSLRAKTIAFVVRKRQKVVLVTRYKPARCGTHSLATPALSQAGNPPSSDAQSRASQQNRVPRHGAKSQKSSGCASMNGLDRWSHGSLAQ